MPDRRLRSRLAQALHTFFARYGWRAYALPVLLVVTVAALLTTGHKAAPRHKAAASAPAVGAQQHPVVQSGPSGPPVAAGQIPLKSDQASGDVDNTVLKSAALPAGASYTKRGDGSFRVLPGTSPAVGSGQLYRYSIEVENGVHGINLDNFQTTVEHVLADSRSWSGHGVKLQRVDSGPIDFRVSLTSAMTVRSLCGYTIPVETSCYIPAGDVSPVNRVVFDDARWVRGATAYIGDLASYREYMVNHEVGHALGHEHAHQCLPGGLAPAMMQQTFGLRSAATGNMCQANPWPYPPGVKGAPGAEQPDTPQNDEYNLPD
jgi:hypothetical protein